MGVAQDAVVNGLAPGYDTCRSNQSHQFTDASKTDAHILASSNQLFVPTLPSNLKTCL